MTILADGAGNTRQNQEPSTIVHCDYLRIHRDSMLQADFEMLLNFVNPHHVVEMERYWSPGGGGVFFDNKVIGTRGFVGGFSVNEDESIRCMLDISGEYWEQLDVIDTWRLFQGIRHRYQMKCSRVDYAIDDFTYSVIPVEKMEAAWRNGLNFGFRSFKYIESGNSPEDMLRTRYFGSRNSGKFTRIYDHDGECLRHEAEFKRRFAQEYFDVVADLKREDFKESELSDSKCDNGGENELSNFGIAIQRTMGGLVVGAIDFRTRDAYKDSSRVGVRDSERLDFYQQYIDNIDTGHLQLRVPIPVKSLSKTFEWVKRNCAQTLAMFCQGLGRHQFNLTVQELVKMGEQRLDNLKQLQVKEIRENPRPYQLA